MKYLNEALEIIEEQKKDILKAEIIERIIFAITDAENLMDYEPEQAEMVYQILGIALDGCMQALYPERIPSEEKKQVEQYPSTEPEFVEQPEYQDDDLNTEEIKIAEEKYNG